MTNKLLASGLFILSITCQLPAQTVPLTLGGTTDTDFWNNFGQYSSGSGLGFPGNGAWPTTSSNPAWTSHTYNPQNGDPALTVGAIRSSTVDSTTTPGLGDAKLFKIRNGTGGGPYPASGSIYFGGFSGSANIDGGTLGVGDSTPLADLKTLAFQIEIGEATGYDFFNDAMPTLVYTTEDGTFSTDASFTTLLSQIYTGSIMMPTGEEDLNFNTWGLQYNLSGITKPILSYHVEFTGVQHAQLYSLQLDQSTQAYSNSVFPVDKVWLGQGTDSLWSTASNWGESIVPPANDKVVFTGSGQAILDTDRTVNKLTLNADDGFTISGPATLHIGNNGIATTSTAPADYTISTDVVSEAFHIINLADNNSLTMSGDMDSMGFYKQGEGDLHLSGDNQFSSGYGLIFKGGNSYISGVNTAEKVVSGGNEQTFIVAVKESTLTLHGGDNRLSENVELQLSSTAFYDATGTTLTKASTGHLVLGDSSGKSDQTFFGINSLRTAAFNEGGANSYNLATSASTIKNGSNEHTTLTVNPTNYGSIYEFWGQIGGSTAAENNISLVKKGQGYQVLGGVNTYSGDTIIEGGELAVMTAASLSPNSNVKITNGATLGIGSAFNINLGTGAGQVQIIGDGGFGVFKEFSAPLPDLILNNGQQIVWGETEGFVADGRKLYLASNGAGNNAATVNFTNDLDLGDQTRAVYVHSLSTSASARFTGILSGTGGIEKLGAGALDLTNNNTFTGTSIVRQGSLRVNGAQAYMAGDVEVRGGMFSIVKTAAENNGNQLADTAKVTLHGGILYYDATSGTPSPAAFSETVGTVHLGSGYNTIRSNRVAAADTSTLTINTLSRDTGAVANFNSASLGLENRNRIFMGGASNGLLGGWAVSGNQFIFYTNEGGAVLSPLTSSSYTATGENTWNAGSNVYSVYLNGNILLSADRQVNSIVTQGNSSGIKLWDLNGKKLTVNSGGIITYTGGANSPVTFSNGTLTAGNGGNAELFMYANGNTTISATVADNGTGKVALVSSGSNTLNLTGDNTYTGGTYVNRGTTNINGNQAGGGILKVARDATVNVNGSILVDNLEVNGTIGGTGTINYAANTTLTGSGTFNKAFTVGTGAGQIAKLSPGNSPGTLNTVSQTWASGGTYLMEINSATGSKGATWDHTNIVGRLDITATEINQFIIDVATLTLDNDTGLLADFNKYTDYSWNIATASEGIFGFNAAAFHLDLTGFQNDITGAVSDGFFSVVQTDANNLALNYTAAVPEPGRVLLLMLGAAFAVLRRKRRRA